MLDMKKTVFTPLCALVISLLLAACGGGGGGGSVAGGGIGGTGITSGTVTGFGSVFVNGVEYFTADTALVVDESPEEIVSEPFDLDSVLDVDMVVTVHWTENSDGTFTANSIMYDEDLEGPVSSLSEEDEITQTRTFNILGVDVEVSRSSTSFVGWSGNGFDQISDGDIVEVSGFFDGNGVLLATRVEEEDDLVVSGEVEVKGVVSGYSDGSEFMLGEIRVTVSDPAILPQDFGNEVIVEVHGIVESTGDPVTIGATEVEIEDDIIGDTGDAKISIEGIVTAFESISNFEVNGQPVDAINAQFDPASLQSTISFGDRVEVEGPISEGGVLDASVVEARGNEIRISAVVTDTNTINETITLSVVDGQPDITVMSNPETEFGDEKEGDSELVGVDGISLNDFLEIEAFFDGSNVLTAKHVVRNDPGDFELRGPVDVPPTGGSSISGDVSILGVIIKTDEATSFEDENEVVIDGDTFFEKVSGNDMVEFKDDVPVDGTADEVSFEN